MKKISLIIISSLLAIFVGYSSGIARHGNSSDLQKNPCSIINNIDLATPFEYTDATITGYIQGEGFVIEADGETATIYGFGPIWFWESLDVDKPWIGDVIDVAGLELDCYGTIYKIAFKITTDGVTVELRDCETGIPYWK